MPPRNYSLKTKKYQKYIQVLQEDEFATISNYCEYLQFLFKYKSLLQFKIAQIQRIEDTKEEVKENEKLYNQIEDEKFVLKVELDKLSRGRYKDYTRQLAEVDGKKLSYEQKLDLVNQMIQHTIKIISQNKYKPVEKFNLDEIWNNMFEAKEEIKPIKTSKTKVTKVEEALDTEPSDKHEEESPKEPTPTSAKTSDVEESPVEVPVIKRQVKRTATKRNSRK